MTIALVTHGLDYSPSGDGFTSASFDSTGADFLVVGLGEAGVTNGVITDSYSNTWTQLTQQVSGTKAAGLWYAANATTGTGHTISVSGTANRPSICYEAWSGLAVASTFDQESGATSGFADSLATGSITPTEDGELLVAFIGGQNVSSAANTIDGGFTVSDDIVDEGFTYQKASMAYLVQTTATAANPTWTNGAGFDSLAVCIASFKAAAGGGGALSGSAAAVFSATGALTGVGALAGASALVFTPAATLTGRGALSGTVPLAFGTAAALTGRGALSGAVQLTFAPTAVATGVGALSGNAAAAFSASGTLRGIGSLSGASSAAFSLAGELRGIGALSGVAALSFAPSGTLTGLGALLGSSDMVFSASGTLSGGAGSEDLAGVCAMLFSCNGVLTGVGSLVGASETVFSTQAQLTGTGQLAGDCAISFGASGGLTGIGALAGESAMTVSTNGALSGVGALAGVAASAFAPVGVLSGIGALSGVASLAFTLAGRFATTYTGLDLILKILSNRQELDAAAGVFRLYDDDDTTVLFESAAWADADGTIPYNGGTLARIDRLQ